MVGGQPSKEEGNGALGPARRFAFLHGKEGLPMSDYQIITIILSVLGLILTALGFGIKVLIEWIKDTTSRKK